MAKNKMLARLEAKEAKEAKEQKTPQKRIPHNKGKKKDSQQLVEVVCACGCGTVFQVTYARYRQAQKKAEKTGEQPRMFYTRDHYYAWKRQQTILENGDPQREVQVRCAGCGEYFTTTYEMYRKGKKFCNKECQKLYLKKTNKMREQELLQREKDNRVIDPEVIDYTPHPAQILIHKSPARFKVINAGVRFGKDRASINEYIASFVEMLYEDRPTSLIPRVLGWIVAPNYNLTRQSWDELLSFFPERWIVQKNVADRYIRTIMDGMIEVKSADQPDSLVSRGVDICLFTEAAKCHNLEDVWANVRSRLSSPSRGPGGKGGKAIINSTPKGKGNYFYSMYLWGQSNDPDYSDWESWTFKTIDNPYIDPDEVRKAKLTMPERLYLQEYEASFDIEGSKVFPYVEEICVLPAEEPPKPGERYEAGYDPAKRGDPAVFSVRDSKGRQILLRKWIHKDYDWQLDQVVELCRAYNYAKLNFDRTGLGEVLETAILQRYPNAEGIFMTNAVKDRLVNNLSLLMEKKVITLQDDKDLKKELDVFDFEILPLGRIRYRAPSGHHDDTVIATGLCYYYYNEQTETLPYVGLLLGAQRQHAKSMWS